MSKFYSYEPLVGASIALHEFVKESSKELASAHHDFYHDLRNIKIDKKSINCLYFYYKSGANYLIYETEEHCFVACSPESLTEYLINRNRNGRF